MPERASHYNACDLVQAGRGRFSSMAVTYYKRFRMEVELDDARGAPTLPPGYFWVEWRDDLIDVHAEVKYRCFRNELDSYVFPCLGDLDGCMRLMREIRRKPGFLPGATWLIGTPAGCIATIQGVIERNWLGSIQNVGVMARFRGQGLGRALVQQALRGFFHAGLDRATLEVTAENSGAVRLYRSMGFHKIKTLYKAVDG
jgi:GNAT superfamily N-acetyltransferase